MNYEVAAATGAFADRVVTLAIRPRPYGTDRTDRTNGTDRINVTDGTYGTGGAGRTDGQFSGFEVLRAQLAGLHFGGGDRVASKVSPLDLAVSDVPSRHRPDKMSEDAKFALGY